MSTVVYDSNPQSRNAVSTLLSAAGQKNVMVTGNSARFLHLLKEQAGGLQMIVLSSRPGEETAVRLTQAIGEMAALAAVPVLYLTDSHSVASPRRDGLSKNVMRVDQFLVRPFGLEKLKKALDAAHVARARSRDVIVMFTEAPDAVLHETLFEFDSEFHWREVVFVSNALELASKIKILGWRVGAVFIDPNCKSKSLRNAVGALRRSPIGAQTLFVLLGNTSIETFLFRDLCELFLAKLSKESFWSPADWFQVLQITSTRLLNNEPSRRATVQARNLIRIHEMKLAKVVVAEALEKDPNRFELLELMGRIEENSKRLDRAVVHYQKAIAINPCAPYSYLRLLATLQGPLEREQILEKSESFCPQHPQLQDKMRQSREAQL